MNTASLQSIWAMEADALERMIPQLKALSPPSSEEIARPAPLPMRVEEGVGVIAIRGPMVAGPEWLAKYGFAITPLITRAIQHATADDKIGGITLMIDSPGGSVQGLAELGDAVQQASQHKPVVAQVDGMATSAAYYVASQARAIYANRMDMIGSIGVRMTLYDVSRMFENEGIKPVVIDTGPFKSTGKIGTPITEEQKQYLQGIVDAYFADFKAVVLRGRPRADLEQAADGRIFVAGDAMRLGLIDGIQGSRQTLAAMADQAKPPAATGPVDAPARRRAQAHIAAILAQQ